MTVRWLKSLTMYVKLKLLEGEAYIGFGRSFD